MGQSTLPLALVVDYPRIRYMSAISHPPNEQEDRAYLQVAGLVMHALTDLCARHAWTPAQVTLMGLETHTWPDASLGVPVLGQMYAQTRTPGLIIRFQAADAIHTYHTSMQGPPRCISPPPAACMDEDHPLIAGAMLDLAQHLGVGFSRIEFDRTESRHPVQALTPSPSDTAPREWAVFLRHGGHAYCYQGPEEGPLVLVKDFTPSSSAK